METGAGPSSVRPISIYFGKICPFRENLFDAVVVVKFSWVLEKNLSHDFVIQRQCTTLESYAPHGLYVSAFSFALV